MNRARARSHALVSLLLAALGFGCSSQDSVFSRGLTKPPSVVTFELGTAQFKATRLGSTGRVLARMKVSGGHKPVLVSEALPAPFSWVGGSFPGVGGTCRAAQLMNGCLVALEFSPPTKGIFTRALSLSYEKSPGSTKTAELPVTGATPAEIALLSAPVVSLGETLVGFASSPILIQIQHLSGAPAKDLRFVANQPGFEYEGGSFPGTSGNCPRTLVSGSCTVSVVLNATVPGSLSALTSVAYDDGAELAEVVTAVDSTVRHPAKLQASPSTASLGRIYLGGYRDFPITLTYLGGERDAYGIALLGLTGEVSFAGGSYPGIGGDCPAAIASGSCTIMIRAQPAALGVDSRTLRIAYRSGDIWAYAEVQLEWEVAEGAQLSWADPAAISFGNVAVGDSAERTVVLSHASGQVVASSITKTLPDGFSILSDSCGSSIPIGGSCSIALRFAPPTRGTFSGNLSVSYNNGGSTASLTLPVSGSTEALLSITPAAGYSFGTRAVGSISSQTFTVTHAAGAPATGISVSIHDPSSSGALLLSASNCVGTLQLSSCSITVNLNPSSPASIHAQLRVAFSNGVSSDVLSVPITATVVPGAALSASVSTLDWGNPVTGGTTNRVLTLRYESGGVAATAIIAANLTAPFGLVTNGCLAGLSSIGQTCSMTLSAAPTAAGIITRNIAIQYNNGASSVTLPVQLTLDARAAAVLVLEGASAPLDFGATTVGTATPQTLQLRHASGAVGATAISSTPPAGYRFMGGSFPGSGGNCTNSLGVGASCTLVVEFAPTIRGTMAQPFNVVYNDGAAPRTATLSVTGRTQALLTFSNQPTLAFGNRATGTQVTLNVTLTHGGGVGASLLVPTVAGAGFSLVSSGCGSSLSVGNCTYTIGFLPTNLGSYSGTLSLSFDNGFATDSISLAISGMGTGAANLQISGTTTVPGTPVVGSHTDITLTVSNTGGAPATAISSANPSAVFTYKLVAYPGNGGNCGSTINPGASCMIILRFSPTNTGSFSATLRINYHNGNNSVSSTASLSGTSQSAALLTLGSTALNFPITPTGTGSELDLVIQHASSTGPASNLRYISLPTSFSVVGGSCPSTITASGSCTVRLRFFPSAATYLSQSVQLVYFDGVVDRTLNFTVTAYTPAEFSLSPSGTVALGDRAIHGSHTSVFTLTRVGGPPSVALSATTSGSRFGFLGGSFPGTGGSCTTSWSGASCTIVTVLQPNALGPWSGTLELQTNDGSATRNLARTVTLTARNPAVLGSPDSLVIFPNSTVGTGVDEILILENSGQLASNSVSGLVTGAGFAFTGGSYPGTGGTCSTTLAAGANCTILVRFTPTGAQSFLGQLGINSHDGAQSQAFSVPLRGEGVVSSPKTSPSKPAQGARPILLSDQSGDGLQDWVEDWGSDALGVLSPAGGQVVFGLSAPPSTTSSGFGAWSISDLDGDGIHETLWQWPEVGGLGAVYEVRQGGSGAVRTALELHSSAQMDALKFAASGKPDWDELIFEDGSRWSLRDGLRLPPR